MSRLSLFKRLSIAHKILLPWFILLVLLTGIISYHYRQMLITDEADRHGRLHQQAVMVAEHLRENALQRWGHIQFYAVQSSPSLSDWLAHSQADSERDILSLEEMFKNSRHEDESVGTGQSQLESYAVARAGHPELYESFLNAVDSGDLDRQVRLHGLLADKLKLVLATLDDLNEYHRKTEEMVSATRIAQSQLADRQLYGLLGLLVLTGLLLAWVQTRAIATPLAQLTAAAHTVERGEDVDLNLFAGHDEIGQLSVALADMVAELKRANEEIASAYAEVEEKVSQRTTELARRSSELETANKDLEGFSYSVSHDLRAPLRAIDGFIAILVEDYGDKLDSEAHRLFGVVQENARKMGELIDDILAFSRAGRLDIQLQSIDMNRLVDEVWAALAEDRQDRTIKFARADLPPVVADQRAIRQVWQNLLANAIKFTRPRPIAHIQIDCQRLPDGMLEYSVCDDGVGFNPDYAGKLFVLFQRLHGMDEFEGTGVGLSLVKRFVQKHHGEVEADGELDQGATFRFRLPDVPLPESLSTQASIMESADNVLHASKEAERNRVTLRLTSDKGETA